MNNNKSYAAGPTNDSLLQINIGTQLQQTATLYPDKEALICIHQDFRINYKDFYQLTLAAAKGLLALGLKSGDRVGIWSPNRYEWVVLQFATAQIGCILVNLNPAYGVSELSYVINQSELTAIFAPIAFKTSAYKEMIFQVKDKHPTLHHVVIFEEQWTHFLEQGTNISDEVLETHLQLVQYTDAVNIQYTSGTTGFPKGVTLSHYNILNNAKFIGKRLAYSATDKVCIPVPFFHCFGMVIGTLTCAIYGATMVIPNDSFDPNITLKTVHEEQCTSLYGVPTMFIGMLDSPELHQYDYSSLRTGVMAGSPCPIEVMKKVQTTLNMRDVSICYGMTETSPVSTQTVIGTPLEKQVTTVGTVQDHLEIKIINPDTQEILPLHIPGELCTRGYAVMMKYWNDPEATAAVIDKNGWIHTGDIAAMDEDGNIKITGRIKDIIIRGGENISPKELEDFLYQYEGISDVQVIGVPSIKYGEEIMAWVKLKPNAVVTEQDLKAYCMRIAHFKRPKYWKFVTEFPMTISGKIKKVDMRAQAIQELGLEAAAKIKTS